MPENGSAWIKWKGSSNMAAAVLLVLVLAVVVSLLSERHYKRWDLTIAGEHSLSEKSLQVLETIKEPVLVKAFVQTGHPSGKDTERLLAAYHYRAPHITCKLIDPDRNPALAGRYQVKTFNTVVLEGYNSLQTVKTPDEESITNALIRLSKRELLTVYWVTGHGERAFKGTEPEALTPVRENLSKENYRFLELNLMQRDVPEDAALVFIAAPERSFFPEEVKSLDNYLKRGGRLIVFLEPFMDAGLSEFLGSYGIVLSQDIIVDKMSRVMGGDFLMPMVASYSAHDITRGFSIPSFFSMARAVEASEEKLAGIRVTSLARTSQDSWAETDREALENGRAGLEPMDRMGPISLAVIAEIKPSPEKEKTRDNPGEGIAIEGKMVVFGDSDFAGNKFFNLMGNSDFIMNTVNYLAGRKDMISIPEKHRPVEALALTRSQGMILFWVPVVLIPLVTLIIGIMVWNRRRSR